MMHSGILEIAAANHFNYRRNLIVPNVSWGWNLNYEADLVVVSPSRYAIEIEIKISIYDLRKDLKKDKFKVEHSGRGISKKFRQFYYLIPEDLLKYETEILNTIPDYAGLIVAEFHKYPQKYFCRVIKPAKINKGYHKLTDEEYIKLSHLSAMRIWDLKKQQSKYHYHIADKLKETELTEEI